MVKVFHSKLRDSTISGFPSPIYSDAKIVVGDWAHTATTTKLVCFLHLKFHHFRERTSVSHRNLSALFALSRLEVVSMHKLFGIFIRVLLLFFFVQLETSQIICQWSRRLTMRRDVNKNLFFIANSESFSANNAEDMRYERTKAKYHLCNKFNVNTVWHHDTTGRMDRRENFVFQLVTSFEFMWFSFKKKIYN